MARVKKMALRSKWLFCVGMLILLLVFLWVFRFQRQVIREEYDNLIIEHLDPNQNVPAEPDKKIKSPGKDPNKTGLHLQGTKPSQIQDYVLAMTNNALQISNQNQVQGPPGPKGLQGEAGLHGGVFLSKGALRSAANPNAVVERLWGMGPGAKCMLVEQTSSYVPPQQTWIHGKNNKITSTISPNECMTFDDDGNVFMNACINAEKWKHRASTNQIQNMGGTKCLAMKKVGSVQANHRITPGKKPTGRPKPLTDQTFLFVEPCDNAKQEQMWSFG